MTGAVDKPKAKRGRKQDDSLPPSRSRDMQRAFRARKAEHLANLEAKVARLESENAELRAKLGMTPRADTPPLSTKEGSTEPTNDELSPPLQSPVAPQIKMEEEGTPSETGTGRQAAAPNGVSPSYWNPSPMEPTTHLPSPSSLPYEPSAQQSRWQAPPGYPMPSPPRSRPPSHDLSVLANLATHGSPYPNGFSSAPYPPLTHQMSPSYPSAAPASHYTPYPPPPTLPSPSIPGGSFGFSHSRLSSISPHLPSPVENGAPTFRPAHQSSFSRAEPISAPNPCRPDSTICPPSACAPRSTTTSNGCGPSGGGQGGGCGPAARGPPSMNGGGGGGCGPKLPSMAASTRGPLPPIHSLLDSSTLPDLDLSPLTALGTYIRPTPLRPAPPSPSTAQTFLDTYSPSSSSSSSAHRTFLLTLISGLELTGKGPLERESFSADEEMQLNTPPGEACCGGIVDCSGSLFEEEVRRDEVGRVRMKDGWMGAGEEAWRAVREFCDEEEDQGQGVEDEPAVPKRRRRSTLALALLHSPSHLAHLLLEHGSTTSRLTSTGQCDSLVSRNVRCESAYGLIVRESAVLEVRRELEARRGAGAGGQGSRSGSGSVVGYHQQQQQGQLCPPTVRYQQEQGQQYLQRATSDGG